MRILFACLWLLGSTIAVAQTTVQPKVQGLSINLKNAPTNEIIAYLAEETGQNVVLFDELPPIKQLRLENGHFEQLLEIIAQANQLRLKKESSIYSLISPETQQPVEPIVLQTKTLQLNYAKASEVIDAITKGSGTILSENGYLHFDDRSNSIILKDSPTSLAALTSLIQQLDKPTEQIAIEARIVTISSANLQELGVRWGMFAGNESTHRFGGNLEGSGRNTNNLNVNFPISNAASAVLQVAKINSRVLDLELTAMERENSVEIIASPRLLTTNKKAASIKQGTEIPYAVYSKQDEVRDIEFREAVLGLEVTPQLSRDHAILLDLNISQNSPSNASSDGGLITIDKQEIKTQVVARHGETIVLGGIFQHLIAKGEDRVPILGSIPVIKKLFSQSRDNITKRELVIFVTPYIVKSPPIEPIEKKAKPNTR